MQSSVLGMLISVRLHFNLETADISFGEPDYLVLHGLKLYTYKRYSLPNSGMERKSGELYRPSPAWFS